MHHQYLTRLSKLIEPRALPHLAPAASGDATAARHLIYSAGNRTRGVIAAEFWRARVDVLTFQIVLSEAWNHDHQHVIAAARDRRSLRAMFRYAAFPAPDLPEVVRIWRGTSGATQRQATTGISWTLDRDVACWFAMRFDVRNPLVLSTEISNKQITHFCDDRSEKEVVVFSVGNAWVDGGVVDWKSGQERRMAEIRNSHEKLLSILKAGHSSAGFGL